MPYFKSDLNALLFLFITTVFVVCSSLGNLDVGVSIFLGESNSDLGEIVRNAITRYNHDHKNSSLEKHVRFNFSFFTYNRMVNSILNLEQNLPALHSAIFVHVSQQEMAMSSVMERLKTVTIGMFQDFQKDEIPTTQVSIIILFVFFL